MHAATAAVAPANVHVEGAHERPLHGQFFLILHRDPDATHRAGTVRALGRQPRLIALIDVLGRTTVGPHAVGRAGLPTKPAGLRDPRPARKRRGLAIHGSTCGVELLFQFLVFPAQALALRLRSAQVLAQPLVFTPHLLKLRGIEGWRIGALRHASVMPDSRAQYKREMRVSLH